MLISKKIWLLVGIAMATSAIVSVFGLYGLRAVNSDVKSIACTAVPAMLQISEMRSTYLGLIPKVYERASVSDAAKGEALDKDINSGGQLLIKQINEYYKQAEAMKKPAPRTEVSKDFDPFPSMVLMLYGSYVGAGKEAQAQAIKDECLRLDDTQTMHEALDNMAQGMRQARKAAAKSNAAAAIVKPEATKRPPAAPLKGKSGTRH